MSVAIVRHSTTEPHRAVIVLLMRPPPRRPLPTSRVMGHHRCPCVHSNFYHGQETESHVHGHAKHLGYNFTGHNGIFYNHVLCQIISDLFIIFAPVGEIWDLYE